MLTTPKGLIVATMLMSAACSPEPAAPLAATETASPVAEAKAPAVESEAVASLAEMPAGDYRLENTHAYITFGYSHLGFSTPHISFRTFDATLGLDPEDLSQSSFELTIDVNSIDSKVEKFDKHLKSPDMFEVEQYPEATFVASQIKVVDGKIAVTGDLTMRDVSKPVEATVTINKAALHPMQNVPTIGLSAQVKLNRSDWGLGYASPAVGEEVSVYFDAEFVRGE